MERDVVLSEEVVVSDLGIHPVLLPVIGLTDDLGVLLGSAEVSDDGIEPHVDDLGIPTFHGDGYAPFHVTGDRTVVESVLQPVGGERTYVGSPPLLTLEVLQELVVESAQPEEVVFGGTDLGG